MEPILNELSVDKAYPNKFKARNGMRILIDVHRGVNRLGTARVLRTTEDFTDRHICSGYTVRQWMNDPQVPKEEKLYFKAIGTRSPYIEEIFAKEENAVNIQMECTFNGTKALGLGVAYLKNSLTVSLDSAPQYCRDPLRVKVAQLSKDDDIIEEEIDVCNLSSTEQVDRRRPWLEQQLGVTVTNGSQIWAQRAELFSRLQFCEISRKQIQKLKGSEPYFQQIVRHLQAIDLFMSGWAGGPFELRSIPWSSESEPTLRHARFGPQREFTCPDNVVRQFSFHSKPTGGLMRIYFLPIQNSGICYIGYVGRKLPTVEFPTL